ncbi:nickel ABC transporter, permease subunit NikC [Desulfofarcimen acetoxidans DSM 771]|uniref:Nickel ABC transporter, permease subunit NikC n=1 Tax=Desulfofarcimen acetoxidans (strain ATCC 49208 / DSM 771 / KCTC 5769 / VKM B-1644 / 5575) TaxID=485916 RepID=C8W4W7_DESAS|nr:nickel ABC transporter permease subunit NikC [Desulfofarcimen acetoxidans]ACV61319.1 nickel ABC transporter, permease subunit NikC [Desulfofarcimen acetoxidans DSM 771]
MSGKGLLGATLARLLKDRLALIGLGIIMLVFFTGVFAPFITPHDPDEVKLEQILLPVTADYPLGTDHLGRCVLSRLIFGTRVSVSTSLLVLITIMLIGIPIGTLSGYYGGRIDNFIMRIIDVLLAFPGLILTLVIAGMLGPNLINVMIALSAVWWVGYARVVRGMVLSIKEKEYVLGARAAGTSNINILVRHIIPNVLSPVIVMATLDMGKLILAISSLSFLGLGAQPPTPEWGAMLNDGKNYMQVAPNLMLFPGIAIMVLVLAFNLLGDGLRDAFDPRSSTER